MKLVSHEHPALRTVSTPVEKDTKVRDIVWAMVCELLAFGGFGMAANQVGVTQRIILVEIDGRPLAIINPVITKRFGNRSSGVEGCLSVPFCKKKIKRYTRVKVTGFNLDWNPVALNLKGLEARCIQHEVDHLNGILIK